MARFAEGNYTERWWNKSYTDVPSYWVSSSTSASLATLPHAHEEGGHGSGVVVCKMIFICQDMQFPFEGIKNGNGKLPGSPSTRPSPSFKHPREHQRVPLQNDCSRHHSSGGLEDGFIKAGAELMSFLRFLLGY